VLEYEKPNEKILSALDNIKEIKQIFFKASGFAVKHK
jgi:hypothetical protein